jgi:hypothetical protein
MTNEISWKECIEKGIIYLSQPDEDRSNQILKMANLRFEFWNKNLDDKFVVLKIEAYYDIIKELIFAHIYKKGYNCTNHLCLIAYLKEKINNFDYETQKIDELRTIRNEINYRGFIIKKDYLKRNEFEFKNIIKRLKEEIS